VNKWKERERKKPERAAKKVRALMGVLVLPMNVCSISPPACRR